MLLLNYYIIRKQRLKSLKTYTQKLKTNTTLLLVSLLLYY